MIFSYWIKWFAWFKNSKNLKRKKSTLFTVARRNSNFNLNLNNFKKLDKLFKQNKFRIVINCAAIVDINYCEKKKKNYSSIINTKFVKYLSEKSKKYNFKLVQISTDHVYKGDKKVPNKENNKIFSINNYAKDQNQSRKIFVKTKKIFNY